MPMIGRLAITALGDCLCRSDTRPKTKATHRIPRCLISAHLAAASKVLRTYPVQSLIHTIAPLSGRHPAYHPATPLTKV